MNRPANDFFQASLWFSDFASKLRLGEIIQVRVRHGVAADFESRLAQFSYLARNHVAGASEKTQGYVESRAKIQTVQNRSGYSEVSFASVVEGEHNPRGDFVLQSIRDRYSAESGTLQPIHLLAEAGFTNYVAHVTLLALA